MVHFCIWLELLSACLFYKVKTHKRFAYFFPQSKDTQTVMHCQFMHFISYLTLEGTTYCNFSCSQPPVSGVDP